MTVQAHGDDGVRGIHALQERPRRPGRGTLRGRRVQQRGGAVWRRGALQGEQERAEQGAQEAVMVYLWFTEAQRVSDVSVTCVMTHQQVHQR